MKRIDKNKLEYYFNLYWNNLKSNLFKLETKQYYQEDGYEDFLNMSKDKFNDLFKKIENDMLLFQSNLWDELKTKKINFERIHIVDLPITGYLQYELLTYKISQKYGEKIYLITTEDCKKINLKILIEDLLLFDERNLIIHHYDEKGCRIYNSISEENEDLTPYINLKNILLKNSLTLNRFMATYDLMDISN